MLGGKVGMYHRKFFSGTPLNFCLNFQYPQVYCLKLGTPLETLHPLAINSDWSLTEHLGKLLNLALYAQLIRLSLFNFTIHSFSPFIECLNLQNRFFKNIIGSREKKMPQRCRNFFVKMA